MLVSHPEQLAHKLGAVAKVLLDQLAANLATETWSNLGLLLCYKKKTSDTINDTDHSEEGCAGLVGDGLRQQGLASARGAVQDHLQTAMNTQLGDCQVSRRKLVSPPWAA